MSTSESGWYVADVAGRAEGPLSREQLLQWRDQGRIARDALVWNLDAAHWRPLSQALGNLGPAVGAAATVARRNRAGSEASSRRAEKVERDSNKGQPEAVRRPVQVRPPATPPKPAPTVPAAAHQGQRLAWGFRRLLARNVDFLLLGGIGCSLLYALAMQQGWNAPVELDLDRQQGPVLFVLAMIPVALLLEALLLGLTGTTPGKWALGLRVLDARDQPMGIWMAGRRAVRVLLRGQALLIPPFSLLAYLVAAGDLVQHGQTHWDRSLDLRTHHGEISGARWWVGLVLLAIGYAALVDSLWVQLFLSLMR